MEMFFTNISISRNAFFCQLWSISGNNTSFGFCLDSINSLNSVKGIQENLKLGVQIFRDGLLHVMPANILPLVSLIGLFQQDMI